MWTYEQFEDIVRGIAEEMRGFHADFNGEKPKTIWNHAEANHILIRPNAPINTSVFEEAEVVG